MKPRPSRPQCKPYITIDHLLKNIRIHRPLHPDALHHMFPNFHKPSPHQYTKQSHQPTLQTLEEAASKFCAICTVLWSILCRHKWPVLPSPTAASLSLQPVSEYRIQRQSGSERSLSLNFTVNANGVGTLGVQGELGVAGRCGALRGDFCSAEWEACTYLTLVRSNCWCVLKLLLRC